MLVFALAQIAITFANIKISEQLVRFIFNIILSLLILPAMGFVFVLLGFHTYLTQTNTTTNEYCK